MILCGANLEKEQLRLCNRQNKKTQFNTIFYTQIIKTAATKAINAIDYARQCNLSA